MPTPLRSAASATKASSAAMRSPYAAGTAKAAGNSGQRRTPQGSFVGPYLSHAALDLIKVIHLDRDVRHWRPRTAFGCDAYLRLTPPTSHHLPRNASTIAAEKAAE